MSGLMTEEAKHAHLRHAFREMEEKLPGYDPIEAKIHSYKTGTIYGTMWTWPDGRFFVMYADGPLAEIL